MSIRPGVSPPRPDPARIRWRRRALLPALILWGLACFAVPAGAATNRALGGIGGVDNGTLAGGDGTGTAQVTIDVADVAFVKQARDLSGAVLPDGAGVAAGQVIWFVLYVDNPTLFASDDVRLTDPLNESEFTYIAGSLERTTVASGSSDATLWTAPWTPLTDDPGGGGDIASVTDTGGSPARDRVTVGAVPAQPNQTVNVPASSRLAIRFRARVN